ncbi:MAG: NAD(P)(+) transhydrogenase (Re/Si-specific) subunit beta, partial [Ferrovibrio sp.]
MSIQLTALLYLVSSVLFILALRGLSSPETSRKGNTYGMVGMAIAVLTTIANLGDLSGTIVWVVVALAIGGAVGSVLARRIQMTAMPQLVAAMHSLVGLAAVLVAAAAYYNPAPYGILDAAGLIKLGSRIEMSLGVVIGIITFSGSLVAFAKLQGLVSGSPVVFKGQHALNALFGVVILGLVIAFCIDAQPMYFWAVIVLSLIVGFTIIIPIGGADMPVVVSMLNSYSGWAAAGIGFTLQNPALIVTGALVGSSGAILSYIMCKGMNRSLFNVILGGFGGDTSAAVGGQKVDRAYKKGSADDAAFIMKNAGKVIIVPGYGMAVSQAQHALREMGDKLKEEGVEVKYAIHPVAGRMPGHMNVLLAEANV